MSKSVLLLFVLAVPLLLLLIVQLANAQQLNSPKATILDTKTSDLNKLNSLCVGL